MRQLRKAQQTAGFLHEAKQLISHFEAASPTKHHPSPRRLHNQCRPRHLTCIGPAQYADGTLFNRGHLRKGVVSVEAGAGIVGRTRDRGMPLSIIDQLRKLLYCSSNQKQAPRAVVGGTCILLWLKGSVRQVRPLLNQDCGQGG